jgi:exodeoxyribonuclease VII small subunit
VARSRVRQRESRDTDDAVNGASDVDSNENRPSSFEDEFAALEAAVEAIESGSLSLDQAIARYETGFRALRRCHEILRDTQGRIETLQREAGLDSPGLAGLGEWISFESKVDFGRSPGIVGEGVPGDPATARAKAKGGTRDDAAAESAVAGNPGLGVADSPDAEVEVKEVMERGESTRAADVGGGAGDADGEVSRTGKRRVRSSAGSTKASGAAAQDTSES